MDEKLVRLVGGPLDGSECRVQLLPFDLKLRLFRAELEGPDDGMQELAYQICVDKGELVAHYCGVWKLFPPVAHDAWFFREPIETDHLKDDA